MGLPLETRTSMPKRDMRHQPVVWSLSEFLNLVELRSQCWCFVELAATGGFRIPHSDAILFYAMLEGSAKLGGIGTGVVDLVPGNIVMVVSGETHALRTGRGSASKVLE